MSERTRDLRIESFRPLLPPLILLEEQPLSERGSQTVTRTRQEIARILRGEDDRLVVIVGPARSTIRRRRSSTHGGSRRWPGSTRRISAS